MEEAMRCELKLPVKRTARIRCGGRVPIEVLASRNPVEGDDRSPSSWAAVEDNDLYIWDKHPKERTPEGPNGDGNDGNEGGNDNGGGDDSGTTVETMATKTPSDCVRCIVELAVNPSGISTRRLMNVSKPWKR
jgi:hypothetical protein